MENIDLAYLSRAESWALANLLIYFLMNGAQIFETLVLVPKWTADPPRSFHYLTDKNGASLKAFWTVFHSVHEVIFIASIAFCWQLAPIRNWLLLLFALHFAVRVWTLVYFAPNIIHFEKIGNGELAPPPNLAEKAANWKHLNYLRVGIFIAVSIGLAMLYLQLLGLHQS